MFSLFQSNALITFANISKSNNPRDFTAKNELVRENRI